MLPATPEDKWAALGFADLLIEPFGEDTFVFNPASGETHLLNQVALSLLRQLSQQAASTAELGAQLLPKNTEQALLQTLQQQLLQLELIGLTCRIPAPS